ncbi:MAG: hypothetical protein ACU0B1_04810 [Thermohalobaculum sp.]
MYQLLGLPQLLRAFGGLTAFVALGAFVLRVVSTGSIPTDLPDLLSTLRNMTGAGLFVSTTLTFLGQSRLFPWACRNTLVGRYFPPIEGKWKGQLTSNWPTIAAMAKLPAGNTGPTEIIAEIKARLFTVGLETKSATGYSTSETLSVHVTKKGLKEALRLAYIYEGRTPQPLGTDSGQHYGAAILDLEVVGRTLRLSGSYWTDRNWSRGLNTAGRLELVKI